MNRSSTCCGTCVAAAILLQGGMAAAASATAAARRARGAATQRPFLGLYKPVTSVDALASLDLEVQSINARLAMGNEAGLAEARDVYRNGFGDLGAAIGASASTSPTFAQFVDYYGGSGFADTWIEASFDAQEFDYGNGSFRFSAFGTEGRAAAIRWGVPLLHVWVSVVALLERATSSCSSSDPNTAQIELLDKAAALYFGSEATEEGGGNEGNLIYSLAQVEGYKYGDMQKGIVSPANAGALGSFRWGKIHLSNGNCASFQKEADSIIKDMKALLVRGALRAMYAMDVQHDPQETTQGMGTAFAAALIPLLHACSPNNAVVVHTDMKPGKGPNGSFEVVKAAVERGYECLDIRCEDVGGLVDFSTNGYLAGFEHCGAKPSDQGYSSSGDQEEDLFDVPKNPAAAPAPQSSDESTANIALAVGLTFGILGGFLLGLVVAFLYTKSKAKKEVVGMTVRTDTEVSPDDMEEKEVEGEII